MLRLFVFLGLVATVVTATAQDLAPVEFNRDALIEMAVVGQISPPSVRSSVYRVEADGRVSFAPGVGSITYNRRVGDSAVDMAGNHVEPAVSLYNLGAEGARTSNESRALNALSCIGNRVRVLDGEAKGAEGIVIGKHGGAEHVMVDFTDDEVYEKLAVGDRMQVRSHGAGIQLTNIDGIKAMNISPALVDALTEAGMGLTDDGMLQIPVTRVIPARIMGSGLGRDQTYTGDYDIQMFDDEIVAQRGLEQLRYGDIVAIENADTSFGRIYKTGAMTVGVVVHGRSMSAGHGPGVTTLFTSTDGRIMPLIDADSNIASLLNIRDLD